MAQCWRLHRWRLECPPERRERGKLAEKRAGQVDRPSRSGVVGWRRPLAVLAAVVGLLSAPATAGAEDDPEMVRYPPSSVRVPLIVGGLSLTAGTYLAAFLCGTVWNDVPGADALKVPVVGPWVALAQSGCAPDDPDCGAILVLRTILTVLDGLAQVGGVGIAAEGIFMTTEADAPDDAADAASTSPSLQLSVAPVVTPHGAGMGVVGSF